MPLKPRPLSFALIRTRSFVFSFRMSIFPMPVLSRVKILAEWFSRPLRDSRNFCAKRRKTGPKLRDSRNSRNFFVFQPKFFGVPTQAERTAGFIEFVSQPVGAPQNVGKFVTVNLFCEFRV